MYRKNELILENIQQEIGDYIYELLQWDVIKKKYQMKVYEEILWNKRRLREALRNCCIVPEGKEYVKRVIEQVLLRKYGLSETSIETLMPFGKERISGRDMFEFLLLIYKRKFGKRALEAILSEAEMSEKQVEIDEKDLKKLYERKRYIKLDFQEKLEFLVQRIYAGYRGLGVVDEIMDQAIDGVSGGVSGTDSREQSVWVFFKGRTLHLSFLEFGSREELIRICRNLSRNSQKGELNQEKGYLIREVSGKSRVVVARPPFAENWVFFVRKFDGLVYREPDDLLTDRNSRLPLTLLKWLIKGEQVIAVTGPQGSGKTTLLMSLVNYIPDTYTLRIQENAFELNLRKQYPGRNIVSFQETEYISGQEGLDFQKKTDGVVSLLGEIASPKLAALMIQLGQAASRYTLFTHHANTTKDLVIWLRNSLMQEGNFNQENVALQQVLDVVRFDVHMAMENGHRYIERITEIVPCEQGDGFVANPLVCYRNGAYILTGYISEKGLERIEKGLSDEEKNEFRKIFI